MNDKFLRLARKLAAKPKLGEHKNLPEMFFFTDRKRVKDIFSVVENLPKNSAVIIREYDLSEEKRLDFAQKIIAIARKNRRKNLKILVGKNYSLARKIKADGVHFSDQNQVQLPAKTNKKMIFSYSCHYPKSVSKAKKLDCDLVFYSPIFVTNSHPEAKPVGLPQLRKFIRQSQIPTYALGGIDEKNIRLLKDTGVAGIGGISIFV
ncbi:MAG: thiE1 [Rickettsiaceae bacterium]|jgi:thiamine-phosphate pyrophosphorylase|nr:thiE1 [Rickettsiaceae bacterium]